MSACAPSGPSSFQMCSCRGGPRSRLGTYSKMAQEITLARVVQAGVVPIDTAAVCSEIQKSWNRDDAAQ